MVRARAASRIAKPRESPHRNCRPSIPAAGSVSDSPPKSSAHVANRVDAIGPGLSYTTLIDKMPLTTNARRYEEYNAERRISGSLSPLSR
jgi:hypothetical protein